MRIELGKLEGTNGTFAHAYQPGELALDDEHARLTRPPEVRGRISRSGSEVRLRGRITARAEVDCDRCLKAIDVPVETDFNVTYVPAEAYAAGDVAELQTDDLDQSVLEDDWIDVDELVREQVLLALPAWAVCRDECQGLCPVCGADRNANACACEVADVDPRWAALADLKPR